MGCLISILFILGALSGIVGSGMDNNTLLTIGVVLIGTGWILFEIWKIFSREEEDSPSVPECSRGGKMKELKPCPFCGSDDIIMNEINKGLAEDIPKSFYPKCKNCDAAIGVLSFPSKFRGMDDAVSAWNTRADDWISVDDRLPEEHQRVLFGVWVTMKMISKSTTYWRDGIYEIEDGELFGDTLETRELGDFTHWQPLPEPPKGTK